MSRRQQLLVVSLLSLVPMAFGILTMFGQISEMASVFALFLTSYGFLGIAWWILGPLLKQRQRTSLDSQVRELSKSLERAGELSAQLNEQIHTRTTELERLRTQSEVARRILSGLTKEEYDAVVAAIRAQAGREKARDLVVSFLLGAATNILTFFLLEKRW